MRRARLRRVSVEEADRPSALDDGVGCVCRGAGLAGLRARLEARRDARRDARREDRLDAELRDRIRQPLAVALLPVGLLTHDVRGRLLGARHDRHLVRVKGEGEGEG